MEKTEKEHSLSFEINKEEQYRKEIFDLLIDSMPSMSKEEKEILKDLFLTNEQGNDELLKKILSA